MANSRCSKGHYYDSSKYSFCPHCGVPGLSGISQTMAQEQTFFAGNAADVPPPPPPLPVDFLAANNDECTVMVGADNEVVEQRPVVGWLVGLSASIKGRDYRLFAGRNTIGRSREAAITIDADRSISRMHAIVVYDAKKNAFSVRPHEQSSNLTYLNDEEVITSASLASGDVIEIGDSKLLFAALCGEKFKW